MKKKSPLKEKPLRYAGESLNQEISRLNDDMIFKYGVYAALSFGLALAEWVRYFTDAKPNPILYTIIAAFVITFAAYKMNRLRTTIISLELGRDGERIVGEFLDELRSKGYALFHDVVGDDFNIDHVICTPSGIYTIETKTVSKPVRGEAKIVYDGKKVLINGLEPDRDPIKQSVSQSKWLRSILKKSTGKEYPIFPVVLYPGWYIDSLGSQASCPAWVLNPKALPVFIENAKQKIKESDLNLAAFHLSRFIRSI